MPSLEAWETQSVHDAKKLTGTKVKKSESKVENSGNEHKYQFKAY
jgi:hypothetical protein